MAKWKRDPQLIDILAADNRERTQHEQAYIMGQVYKRMVKSLLVTQKALKMAREQSLDLALYEKMFAAQYGTAVDAGVSQDIWSSAVIMSVRRSFGEPKAMYETPNKLIHHKIPYINPTVHPLNIKPLGLIKSVTKNTQTNIDIYEMEEIVPPGAIVNIPVQDTLGGKYSTIMGVAPQLKPCPRQEDSLLDISPTSHAEWCTHMSGLVQSGCCFRAIVWSDTQQHLLCSRCGERCTGC